MINGHVAAKYIYVRLFRGTDRMHKRTVFSIGSWVAIILTLWIIAWIIAEAIPVFNDLLSLIVSAKMLIRAGQDTDPNTYRLPFLQAGSHVSAPRPSMKNANRSFL